MPLAATCRPGVGQNGKMSASIGANIRRLRKQHGWSQADLALRVCQVAGINRMPLPLGRQEISRYENGKRHPREWLRFIAAALGVSVEQLTAEHRPADLPPASLEDYLPPGDPLTPLAERPGGRLGMSSVEDLQQRVHGLRLADDVIAGGDLVRPALRELRTAVKLYRNHTHADSVGRALLQQIGELAQITGWIASDAGQHEEAEHIYKIGLDAARRANDATLAGNLAGTLAYQLSNTGRESEGVALARAALDEAGPSAPPKARALYLDRVAWAHTKAGQAQSAMRALGEAGEALAQDSDAIESPAYLYWVDEGELRVMESRVYTELRRPLRAVPLLRNVLDKYDTTHTREFALYLSWLAVALADANEPEEAASTAARVIDLSADLTSERTTKRVRVVLDRLTEYRNVPEVRALLGTS